MACIGSFAGSRRADIRARVQALVSNTTLSIRPNALNTVKQPDLGTDRKFTLFLMRHSFLAGVSEPPLNDLTGMQIHQASSRHLRAAQHVPGSTRLHHAHNEAACKAIPIRQI
jgi:hypothetical protein